MGCLCTILQTYHCCTIDSTAGSCLNLSVARAYGLARVRSIDDQVEIQNLALFTMSMEQMSTDSPVDNLDNTRRSMAAEEELAAHQDRPEEVTSTDLTSNVNEGLPHTLATPLPKFSLHDSSIHDGSYGTPSNAEMVLQFPRSGSLGAAVAKADIVMKCQPGLQKMKQYGHNPTQSRCAANVFVFDALPTTLAFLAVGVAGGNEMPVSTSPEVAGPSEVGIFCPVATDLMKVALSIFMLAGVVWLLSNVIDEGIERGLRFFSTTRVLRWCRNFGVIDPRARQASLPHSDMENPRDHEQ